MSLKRAVERRHAMPDKEIKENGPELYFREAPLDVNAKQKMETAYHVRYVASGENTRPQSQGRRQTSHFSGAVARSPRWMPAEPPRICHQPDSQNGGAAPFPLQKTFGVARQEEFVERYKFK